MYIVLEMSFKKLLYTFVLWHILLAYVETAEVSTVAPVATAARSSQESNSINTRNADRTLFSMCPNMLAHVFENAAPQDETNAGVITEYVPAKGVEAMNADVNGMDLSTCIAACCAANNNDSISNNNNNFNSSTNCHVVFTFKRVCYHVRCYNNEGCLPKRRAQFNERVQTVLVQPIMENEHLTWTQILRANKEKQQFAELDKFLNNAGPDVHNQRTAENDFFGEKIPMNFWKKPRKFHYSTRNQVN